MWVSCDEQRDEREHYENKIVISFRSIGAHVIELEVLNTCFTVKSLYQKSLDFQRRSCCFFHTLIASFFFHSSCSLTCTSLILVRPWLSLSLSLSFPQSCFSNLKSQCSLSFPWCCFSTGRKGRLVGHRCYGSGSPALLATCTLHTLTYSPLIAFPALIMQRWEGNRRKTDSLSSWLVGAQSQSNSISSQ